MDKKSLIRDFEHKKYGFFEDASVQVCEWNKKALRSGGKEHCYKQDFYGVDCASCHQVTPVTFWCNNSCIFCWRPKEYMRGMPPAPLDPKEMIDELIKKRAKLISGFGGHDKVSSEKYVSALVPKHWAISLSGEPTLYNRLPEFISLLNGLAAAETVFLVTNGQNPNMLLRLWKEDSLPTQLYVSMVAPKESLWKSITCNKEKGGWKTYLKSLALLKLLPCRTVIRLTVIKGLNDSPALIKEFAEVLEAVQSDFVEIKAYMWLGYSRKRLEEQNMPFFEDIKYFTKSLLALTPSYVFEAEKKDSRIVLLKRRGSKHKTKIISRS